MIAQSFSSRVKLVIAGAITFICISILAFSPILAQGEPTIVIDAVFQNLNARTGQSLSRLNTKYTWEERVFADASMGCAQPDQAYAQVQTRGYIVTIQPVGSTTIYEYRATTDGKIVFPCTADLIQTGTPNTPLSTVVATATVLPPTTVPPTLSIPTAASTSTTLSGELLAYVGDDGNVYVSNLAAGSVPVQLTNDANIDVNNPSKTPDHVYVKLAWSPTGKDLAWVDASTHNLMLASSGQPAKVVANNLASDMGISWTADGKLIYATPTTDLADPQGNVTMQVNAISGIGMPAQTIGKIMYGFSCSNAGFNPAEMLLMREAGPYGNEQLLMVLPQGILHSASCTGVGLRLTDLAGKVVWEQADLKRAAITPDSKTLFAIRQSTASDPADMFVGGKDIVSVDAATGVTKTIVTLDGADRLGVSGDGQTVYVATRTISRSVSGNASIQSDLLPNWPGPFNVYTLTLYQVALADSQPRALTTTEGQGISKIVAVTGQPMIVFSVVESLAGIAEKLTPQDSILVLSSLLPRINLYSMTLSNTPQAAILGAGHSNPALTNTSAFQIVSAPTVVVVPATPIIATPLPTFTPAATLALPVFAVGQKVLVTVQRANDALNLRRDPSTNAQVLRILKADTVLTILAGPTDANGFQWWQVSVDETGETGWVVAQVVENGVPQNTLRPQ